MKTKKYNYFYCGQAIKKVAFEQNVPDNWESQVRDGEYSSGYYRAIQRD